ncbi:uncharacterized protein METZ01_LOCUS361413, partial [marine metagenome]
LTALGPVISQVQPEGPTVSASGLIVGFLPSPLRQTAWSRVGLGRVVGPHCTQRPRPSDQ